MYEQDCVMKSVEPPVVVKVEKKTINKGLDSKAYSIFYGWQMLDKIPTSEFEASARIGKGWELQHPATWIRGKSDLVDAGSPGSNCWSTDGTHGPVSCGSN